MKSIAALLFLAAAVTATVYLEENFDNGGFEDRWVDSTSKSDIGKFKLSTGKYYSSSDNKGLQTSTDAKFYQSTTKFDKFSNKDKDLVIQFSVKHEQDIDCGGGYVKVWPSTLEQTEMTGDSEYNVMFGPDICGPGTRKVHTIFAYKGENLQNKKSITPKTDTDSHLYTLIIKSDNTYEVQIDGAKVEGGSLYEDFDFLPPKTIKDPSQSKPEDWVDDKTIADPEDTKPEDWDQPEHVADPEATKPEDWDDEMDGEWEPPMIDNPDYKGEWKPKQIDNPEYKGEWVHPEIANPDYFEDDSVYSYDDFGVIGFDIWQVKSGTVFDNLLVTDDIEAAAEAAKAFKDIQAAEKKMKEEEEAKKKAEEEAAAAAAADDEEEEIEDEEEDDTAAKDEL